MMLRWLSMLAVASALVASPAAATTRVVDLPDDPESFACQARGPQAVHVRDDAGVDARAFAVDLLRAHARGFFVLGASARAIWVLEAYIPVDACDSVDCVRVALREVRFDGRRITHVLSEGDDAVAPVDRAIGRLGAMAELARLTPVAAETNPRPRLSQGGRSDWVLRIRDSVHRKTYFWRIAQRRVMCWCARQHELSTFVWGA